MKKTNTITKDIERIFSFNLEDLLNLPCHVFWKNQEGTYQGYNDYGAIRLGYTKGDEVINQNDLEIFPKDIALSYQENDRMVMRTQEQIFFPELGVLKKGAPVRFLSYKIPIYNNQQLVSGILGMSFTRSVNITISADQLAADCNHDPFFHQPSPTKLSERENVCMQYLCIGLTIKEIARKLQISPRTVECYIDRVKEKLNCHNKATLIAHYLNCLHV